MNEGAFLAYVQQVLVSTLARGDIIITDNLPAHKAQHASRNRGCETHVALLDLRLTANR